MLAGPALAAHQVKDQLVVDFQLSGEKDNPLRRTFKFPDIFRPIPDEMETVLTRVTI